MSPQPVRDMTLLPAEEPKSLAPVGDPMLAMIERIASSPTANMDNLERMIAMHERGAAKLAEEQFNAAMSLAQKSMRPVAADASNPQTRSKYASYSALDRALRPIYTEHTFSLSFNTADSPLSEHVRVLCYVAHSSGHSRTYHVDIPADGKGAKGGDVMTKTHAVGSALSYGMRYLLKMVFNVAVGEEDDDGNRAANTRPAPQVPAGFDKWLADIEATADTGTPNLRDAWKRSDQKFVTYIGTLPAKVEALKARAKKADGGQ